MQSQLIRNIRTSSLLDPFICLALLLAFAVVNPAAALEEVDWQNPGDGLLTFDPETGLQWLDLTETTNMTVGEVSAELGVGGDFEGFRYASAEEAGDFYTNAGLSGFATAPFTVTGNSDAMQIAAAEDLQDLWGITYPQPGFSQNTSSGFIDESVGEGVFRLTSLTVRVDAEESADIWAAGTRASSASSASDNWGSALVRSAAFEFRDDLLGAESDTGHLLAIDPAEVVGLIIGDTGIRQMTALAKDPVTGVLYGAGHPVFYTYRTTLDLTLPLLDGIDTVVIDWVATKNTGAVGTTDLDYLSIALLDGESTVFIDTPIIDGIPQPIDGEPREITDIFWDFRHDTNELYQIFNVSDAVLSETSGIQYQISDKLTIPAEPELVMIRYDDGVFDGRVDSNVDSQDTPLPDSEIVPTLYTLDEDTGEATRVGVIIAEDECEYECEEEYIVSTNGADFDATGQLWAAVTVEEEFACDGVCFYEFEALARIDKNIGSAEIIGEFGESFSYDIDGISFDSDGDLWGVSSSNDVLFLIDLEEGEAEFEIALVGSPPGDGFQSLQFACDDTLFAGTAQNIGEGEFFDGGELFTIDTVTGVFTQVGSEPVTDGSTLGGLALRATCGTSVVDAPTPVGEDVTVIDVQAFKQVAGEVVEEGSTSAFFCVLPDIRYLGDTFVARNLNLLEVMGMGSCNGPLVPGDPGGPSWEDDIFPNLNLVIPSWFQSYRGKFTLPGDAEPTEDYWLVLGVVQSTAEFDGPVAYTTFPETLIDYGGTPVDETPGCDRDLAWRNLDIAGAVPAFGDFPNFEGNRMIVETGQCNRSRGLTRRTTHIYPTRFIYPAMGPYAEFMNLAAQLSGISGTLVEAASCTDMTLIVNMQMSLQAAQMSFAMSRFMNKEQNLADAEEHLEQIARFAKLSANGFDGCDVERNYRGNFMSRAVTAAFTVHDRFEHAVSFVKYFPPADLELPILDPED